MAVPLCFSVCAMKSGKHDVNEWLTLDFMFTLVYMVFLEWGKKVMVLPTGKRVFKNSKTCFATFLEFAGRFSVMSPSWCFGSFVAKN